MRFSFPWHHLGTVTAHHVHAARLPYKRWGGGGVCVCGGRICGMRQLNAVALPSIPTHPNPSPQDPHRRYGWFDNLRARTCLHIAPERERRLRCDNVRRRNCLEAKQQREKLITEDHVTLMRLRCCHTSHFGHHQLRDSWKVLLRLI